MRKGGQRVAQRLIEVTCPARLDILKQISASTRRAGLYGRDGRRHSVPRSTRSWLR